ncbi:MAG: hypothetical protein JSS95_09420 [Acidobacteria bacterium]|nr:hypothetical protein [Acidobacteriota bacterium]
MRSIAQSSSGPLQLPVPERVHVPVVEWTGRSPTRIDPSLFSSSTALAASLTTWPCRSDTTYLPAIFFCDGGSYERFLAKNQSSSKTGTHRSSHQLDTHLPNKRMTWSLVRFSTAST